MIILNRREKLRASVLPPEIPDGSTLVKKTDKASASKLGLVKIGDNISISSAGAISVPVGNSETPGVYKVGVGLSVADGVLSATGSTPKTVTQLINKSFTANTEESFPADVNPFSFKKIVAVSYASETEVTFGEIDFTDIPLAGMLEATPPVAEFRFLIPLGTGVSIIKISSTGVKVTNNAYLVIYGIN